MAPAPRIEVRICRLLDAHGITVDRDGNVIER
jgi:hypothetical protein